MEVVVQAVSHRPRRAAGRLRRRPWQVQQEAAAVLDHQEQLGLILGTQGDTNYATLVD